MKKPAVLFFAILFLSGPSFCADGGAHSHFLKGLLLENDENYSEALKEYRETIRLDPESEYVYRHAVNSALRAGEYKEASALAQKLIEFDQKNAENWTMLAASEWALDKKEDAAKYYEKALELAPDNPDALFQLAALIRPVDPAKALSLLERYAEIIPGMAYQTYYDMAVISFEIKKGTETETYLKRSLDSDEDFMPARYSLAQYYEIANDTASALGQYLEIERREPENPSVLSRMCEIYMSGGKDAEARLYCGKTVKVKKSDAAANFWLAVLSERDRDFLSAVKYLENSENYRKDAGLWLRAGYYLTQLGRYRDAVELMRRAYKKWPDNAELGYFLALGLDDIGSTREAMAVLSKLLDANPSMRDYRLQYAMMAEKTGDIALAETHFKRLLEAKPDDAMTLNYLGYSLADRGLKLDEAERYIARAVELDPESGACRDSLGWVHFRQGKYEAALGELKKAAELSPEDDAVWEHLGQAYDALKEPENAWYCFKAAGALRQSNKKAAAGASADEKNFDKAQLGGLYLKYLAAMHSGLKQLSALCKVAVKAGGKTTELNGILTYKPQAGLSLEVLGAMFAPVLKMTYNPAAAQPLSIDGGILGDYGEAFSAVMGQAFVSAWSYYSGQAFAPGGAEFSSSVFGAAVKNSRSEILLDSARLKAARITRREAGKIKLALGDYKRFAGRLLPGRLECSVPGMAIRLEMIKTNPEFETPALPFP